VRAGPSNLHEPTSGVRVVCGQLTPSNVGPARKAGGGGDRSTNSQARPPGFGAGSQVAPSGLAVGEVGGWLGRLRGNDPYWGHLSAG
jgi:hypothetical protein